MALRLPVPGPIFKLTERLPCLDTLAPHAAARIALPVEMFTEPMLMYVRHTRPARAVSHAPGVTPVSDELASRKLGLAALLLMFRRVQHSAGFPPRLSHIIS
jgi:hypothetical protein